MRWTDEKVDALKRAKGVGLSHKAIAALLGCTQEAVKKRWQREQRVATEVRNGNGITRVLCYGDEHRPFHDEDACSLMWDIAKRRIKPDVIIHLGDLLDFPEISRFRKSAPMESNLKEGLDSAREHFRWLAKNFPGAEKWFLVGNHDQRWANYIADNAPEITVVEEVQLHKILGLEELGIKWVERKPKGVSLNLGKIVVGHWARISKHSGYTAKALVTDLLHSCLQAHTHRLGSHFHTGIDMEIVGFENGCLCRLDPSYEENPNWQQGFSVICMTSEGYFQVQNIPIVRVSGKGLLFAFYGGEFFSRRIGGK